MSLKQVLLADLRRQWRAAGSDAVPSSWGHIVRSLANNKFLPVVLVRLAHELDARGVSPLAKICSLANQVLFGVEVAIRSDIGPGLYFPHTGGIVLGAQRIGSDVTIYHGVTLGAAELDVAFTPGRRPLVGDNVVIASGAKVLGGVMIRDGAIVGANAVVVDDVGERWIVGGVPAKFLKQREGEDSW